MLNLYKLLWWIVYPFLFVYSLFNPGGRVQLKKRMLQYPLRPRTRSIWFHCASLGEAKGLLGVIRSFNFKDTHLLVTATTVEGWKLLEKTLSTNPIAGTWSVRLAPLDHEPLLKKWIANYNVAALVLYEQEIWPNVINLLNQKSIPVILAAARYTPQAQRKYAFIKPLVQKAFSQLHWAQAQNTLEQTNLKLIMKKPTSSGFDYKLTMLLKTLDGDLQKIHGDGFAFISLHRHELDILMAEMILMAEQVPVYIFPRYMKDVEYFYSKLSLVGCIKWSESKTVPPPNNLILVDSMGQIIKQARYYNMCFVGGSFVNIGGHNVWEPFLEGIKIIIGPYHYNQSHAVNLLKSNDLLNTIEKPEDILKITYEPYSLEAASNIISGLKREYNESIQELGGKLKPILNNLRVEPILD